VLVIEAGPRYDANATRALVRDIGADHHDASDVGIEAVEVPFLCASLSPNTPLNWNYTTVPQPGLNGRTISYPRGRVVGGSSSISQ
jgi:choline dehydrogenase-like flavoprotein